MSVDGVGVEKGGIESERRYGSTRKRKASRTEKEGNTNLGTKPKDIQDSRGGHIDFNSILERVKKSNC